MANYKSTNTTLSQEEIDILLRESDGYLTPNVKIPSQLENDIALSMVNLEKELTEYNKTIPKQRPRPYDPTLVNIPIYTNKNTYICTLHNTKMQKNRLYRGYPNTPMTVATCPKCKVEIVVE